MTTEAPYLWIGLIGLLLGGVLALWLARAWRRLRLRRRFRRARAGELAVEPLLSQRGFRVLDEQVRRRAHLLVDGEPVEYEVRADLLAVRGGRTYVVEVKTGKTAPKPSSAATRRQLREYAAVYAADGLLLADMSAGELHEIRFPNVREPTGARVGATGLASVFLLGAASGVALAWLVLGVSGTGG